MSSPPTRVALITGTSRGIGTALAAGFAADGYAVVGCGRSARPDVDVAGMDYRRCDVSDPAAIRDLIAGTVASHGRLDVLVNNAAVEIEGTVEETTVEQWDEVLSVNVRAPALLSCALARTHPRGTPGRIVNLISGQFLGPMPGELAYTASKGALQAFTVQLAAEVAPLGITVNAVGPGPNDTGWMDDALRAELLPRFPMGRIGRPEDAAALVAFLCSEEAGWVTGQVVHAEGGFLRG